MRHHMLGLTLIALVAPSSALSQSRPLDLAMIEAPQEERANLTSEQLRMNAYMSTLTDVLRPSPRDEEPIGYFARRQVTECNSCHVAIPKLNTFGRLVKNMGYQLPELDLSLLHEAPLKKAFR